MADVIITIKVVLESPEIEAEDIEGKVIAVIEEYNADVGNTNIEEVAYGIKAVKAMFIMNENKGGTDILEEKIKEIKGVSSVEVIDIRRAVG